ncbi:serine/threonine-protein kinase [Streptomyces capitiformicae]|uniref:Serine/threonine protein kinase n=1 Tax=Streptomyces capitiformicae TaxID=2014920 RepID=A0A919LCU9_9ACTN|nr:serine/threonine-protein kinase [Streptomyces capitiformicae]GHH88811.1 serine/threonine protein kinase [Streptomyces capitiformicae]
MTGHEETPHVVPVPKGYRVGRWEIRRPIASGAFATVYEARTTTPADGLPARVALKFLATGTRTPRQVRHLRDLAEREVDLLSRLHAPRLVRMFETLTVDDPHHPELDGATVLVLERAEDSLDAVLDRTPHPASGPLLLAQVCAGLHQLHQAGWVHGDLKPANVLLMQDGTARLADFSTSAELDGTHAYSPAFATRDYTPPELLWPETSARGTLIRPTADIWAFGVLAHLVLTGTHPLPGATPEARCDAAARYAQGTEELRLSPDLPEVWRHIISDCLARTHEERAAAHDTEALLSRVEQAAYGAGPVRRPRRRAGFRRRHPVLAAALASVLLATACATVAGYAYVNHDDGTPVYAALPAASKAPVGPDGKVTYGYHRCPEDSVCFFSEHNGTGKMCSWRGDDTEWLSGEETCAWAGDRPVRSVYNNIAAARDVVGVAYFRGPDFSPAGDDRRRPVQRTGCTSINSMGNLSGTYAPRSHRLVSDCFAFTAIIDTLTHW